MANCFDCQELTDCLGAKTKAPGVVACNSGPENGGLRKDTLAGVVGCNSGAEDGGLEKDELAGVVGCNSGPEDGQLEKDELTGVVDGKSSPEDGGSGKDEFSDDNGLENCVTEKGEVPVSNCEGGEDGELKDD